jgi:hypothetical protein
MLSQNIYVDDKTFSTSKICLNSSLKSHYKKTWSFPDSFIALMNKVTNSIGSSSHFENSISYTSFISDNQILEDNISTIASYEATIRPSDSFLKQLKKNTPPPIVVDSLSDNYPIAVRYTDGKSFWIIERPPFKATINYKTTPASKHSKQEIVDLWMPWTVMILFIDPQNSNYNTYLLFNDSPITSLDDLAIPCFHMNMYDDARMCLNSSFVMLQQHLSQTNDYSISNIYNFVLNDYMTGGWNADLSLNVFDRISYRSKTISEIKNLITNGDPSKGIKSSLTSRGYTSYKKYYKNYFSYFSTLTLEEILSIISKIKNEFQIENTTHNYRHNKTFNHYINLHKSDTASNSTSIYQLNNSLDSSYLEVKYRLFFDLKFKPLFIDDNEELYILLTSVHESVKDFINDFYSSQINLVTTQNHFYFIDNFQNDKNLFINSNLKVCLMDDNFDYTKVITFDVNPVLESSSSVNN